MDERIKTDFSKIGELFYRKISNSSTEASLPGFIRHAMEAFDEYAKLGNNEFILVEYPSIDRNSKLIITIVPSYNNPDLAGLEIIGRIKEHEVEGKPEIVNAGVQNSQNVSGSGLQDVLDQLLGFMTVEFSGLTLDTLPRQVQSKIEGSIRSSSSGKIAKINGLTVYFNRDSDVIRKADILKPEGPMGKAISVISKDVGLTAWFPETKQVRQVKCCELDFVSKTLIEHAARISVSGSYYFNEDWTKELIHEKCQIVKTTCGYHWHYQTRSAQDVGLPAKLFDKLQTLYNIVQQGFDVTAFEFAKIMTPREASYVRTR